MIYVAFTAEGTDKTFFYTIKDEEGNMEDALQKTKEYSAMKLKAEGIIDSDDEITVYKAASKDGLQDKLDQEYENPNSGE